MSLASIDLRRLSQLVAVVEAEGVREAARRIRVAQPALSRTVAELEEELGLRLFVRTRRRMVPTPEARIIARDARALLADAEALVSRARALAGGTEGRLRLGTSPSATLHPRVAELVGAFRGARPGVEIELVEGPSAALVEAVEGHRVDAAFVRPSAALPSTLRGRVLVREALFAVVAAGHPLAKQRRVGARALLQHPLLLPSPELRSSLRALVDRLALEHDVTLHVAVHASHLASLIHLAASGMGVAIVPESLKVVAVPGVCFVRLASTEAVLPLVLVHRSEAVSPAIEAFLSSAR